MFICIKSRLPFPPCTNKHSRRQFSDWGNRPKFAKPYLLHYSWRYPSVLCGHNVVIFFVGAGVTSVGTNVASTGSGNTRSLRKRDSWLQLGTAIELIHRRQTRRVPDRIRILGSLVHCVTALFDSGYQNAIKKLVPTYPSSFFAYFLLCVH